MKGKFISNGLLLMSWLILFSCNTEDTKQLAAATQYTCPMHPNVVQDTPGTCPICGMDLVPMDKSNELHIDSSLMPLLKPGTEQVVSSIATIRPEDGRKLFSAKVQGIVNYDERAKVTISSRVTGRIEKMHIKYNYQPVQKGQLIMEVYSPDLAAAQRELIYLSSGTGDEQMLARAKQKLQLLGMPSALIQQVMQSRKPIYRLPVYSDVNGYIVENGVAATSESRFLTMPTESDAMGMETSPPMQKGKIAAPSPVLVRAGQYVSAGEPVFTVYKERLVADFYFPAAMSSYLRSGQKVLYSTESAGDELLSGSLDFVLPVQSAQQGFSIGRLYLTNTALKPGQLLKGNIAIVRDNSFWLPQNAVVQLGNSFVIYKKEDGVFIARPVETGLVVNGMVEVKDEIGDWQVAANAGFFHDNESFLRVTK